MSSSFDLRPDRFTAGAVGPPGRRVFYLQAVADDQVVTLRLEKQQVAALAEYLAGILSDLPPPDAPTGAPAELVEPALEEWVVGSLGVAYEEAEDRVLLVAEELVIEEGDEPARRPAVARFHLTRTQVAAFVEQAAALVRAGRPRCRVCGRPMDPDGHVCPRGNGHSPG